METLPATRQAGTIATITVSEEQKALVKSVIFPDSTDGELALFIHQCTRKGVHPLDKMIYPIKRGQGADAKLTFQSSIDFMRSEAEGTGEYDGQDEPEFEFDGTTGNDKWPSLARVRLYRKGIVRPFIGVARWEEFYPGEKSGMMYRKMPTNQLAKCAEAQALRKAFPKLLGDLYEPAEMAQADVAPGDKAKGRAASVRPAASARNAEAVDAEVVENPIDVEIYECLKALHPNGEFDKMDASMKEASHYPKDGKTFEFGFDRIPTASAGWKGRALTKLKKMVAAAAEHADTPGMVDAEVVEPGAPD